MEILLSGTIYDFELWKFNFGTTHFEEMVM